jgi:hypothetical protein
MSAGEKHRADVELITKHFVQSNQRPEAVEYMNAHISSYLASKDGFIYNEEY